MPTIWDCVSAVLLASPSKDSNKQKQIINSLCHEILELWKLVFPKDVLISKWSIKTKLERSITNYIAVTKSYKDEKIHEFRKAKKKVLLNVLKPEFRKNLDSLPKNLVHFYNDQCGERTMSFDLISENSFKNEPEEFESSLPEMDIDGKSIGVDQLDSFETLG